MGVVGTIDGGATWAAVAGPVAKVAAGAASCSAVFMGSSDGAERVDVLARVSGCMWKWVSEWVSG